MSVEHGAVRKVDAALSPQKMTELLNGCIGSVRELEMRLDRVEASIEAHRQIISRSYTNKKEDDNVS